MPSYIRAFLAPAAVPGVLPRIAYILSVYCAWQKQIRLCASLQGAQGRQPTLQLVVDLGAPRAQTRRQQVRGGVVHCSVKTLGARENNVQVKRHSDLGYAKN